MKHVLLPLVMRAVIFFVAFSLTSAHAATITYRSLAGDIANPERGFHEQTFAYDNPSQPTTYSPLRNNTNLTDGGTLKARKITVVQRVISLSRYVGTDALPTDFTAQITDDFVYAREIGIKLYLRFSYTSPPPVQVTAFVPTPRIMRHIEQLGSIITANADVVTHLDAGMLGDYGEWYAGFPVPPGTDKLREDVVKKWLSVLPTDRTIALRTPSYKRAIFGQTALDIGFDGSDKSRVGQHNDCFLKSITDLGTFSGDPTLRANERMYLRDETRFVVQSGETCGLFKAEPNFETCGTGENCTDLTNCTNALTAIQNQRWSLLNTRYAPELVIPPGNSGNRPPGLWHQEPNACYQTIKQRLGYRFELLSADLPDTVAVGGQCTWNATIRLRNVGVASPFNPRPVRLVLKPVNGGQSISVDVPANANMNTDPRLWLPDNGTITMSLPRNLPSTLVAGAYDLYLHLPDGRTQLAQRADYSIRFANEGTWDESTGMNNLNHRVTIMPCPNLTNYSDMWWAGSVENGWGMSIQQNGNGVQFNAIYVYDAAGQPRWYVMPGGSWNSNFTVFSGALYQPTSAPLNNYSNTQLVVGASVGNATISFTSNRTANLSYTINGITGSKAIERQSFSGGIAPFDVKDMWWSGGNQSGWGLNLAQQGGTIFGVWYTYGADGKTAWFVMPGGAWTGSRYAGKLYTTTGSSWLGAVYNANALRAIEVGTLALDFRDANNAIMSYSFTNGSFNGLSQNKPIVRQPY